MKMDLIILVNLVLMLCVCSQGQKQTENASSKSNATSPNIIIFLADDVGYGDLSFSGHPTSRTPAIDDLARNGRYFTHFYVPSPVCSPSRASILTGRYHVRSGTYPATYVPDNYLGLPGNETTIAEVLKEKGYKTQIVGKWHLGVGVNGEFLPSNPAYGFDDFYGLPYSQDMCPCPVCYPNNGSCSDTCFQKYGDQFVSCPLYRNSEIVEQPVYLPDLSGRLLIRAMDFVKEAHKSGKSFFLYYAFHHIHHPQFASSMSVNKSPRGPVGDSLWELDSAVRSMMDLLKQLNLLDDTFVWFTSDNGPSLKHHELGGCAGPLRCGKGTTWEGGVRVPSIVYWKDKIAPGRSNALTSALDMLPTVSSIAGITTDHLILDGIDLSPLLLQEQTQIKRDFLAIYPEHPSMETGPFAIVYKNYKAHFYTKGSILSDDHNNDKFCTPMHTVTKHDPPLLFDLYEDPGEKYHLGNTTEYRTIISIMSDWRDEHMRNMTWMPPRTLKKLGRSQPCCTHRLCHPFPQCCDCSSE